MVPDQQYIPPLKTEITDERSKKRMSKLVRALEDTRVDHAIILRARDMDQSTYTRIYRDSTHTLINPNMYV